MNVTKLPLTTCILLAGVCAHAVSAQAPPLWGDLQPGSFDVGFRRIWMLDHSRVWPRSAYLDSLKGDVARPVRVDVWYPASCEGSTHMPLAGYLQMKSPGPAFDDVVFLTHRWDAYSYHGLAEDTTAFDRLMAVATAACPEAPAAAGRFPVVVYSAGWFNRAPDNTILAEYLAGHGFVVAAIPQLNPGLWTYNFRSDARSVENQTRDLEVALGGLIEEPYVDRRRVAAMGYSTGGDVALLMQGRNDLVDAVVGLDASWSLGPDNDVVASPFFDPAHHHVPILVARRPADAASRYDAVLDSLREAPRLVVAIPGADHGSFSDDPAQRLFLGTGSAAHDATRMMVARTVLAFLRSVFREEGSFDGRALRSQYAARGLEATYLPASSEEEGDANDGDPP